jgi:hypothetical protein
MFIGFARMLFGFIVVAGFVMGRRRMMVFGSFVMPLCGVDVML